MKNRILIQNRIIAQWVKRIQSISRSCVPLVNLYNLCTGLNASWLQGKKEIKARQRDVVISRISPMQNKSLVFPN